MDQIRPESKMLEEVRRWRKETYEERSRQTLEERIESDRALIESLGLTKLLKPVSEPSKVTPPIRKAG